MWLKVNLYRGRSKLIILCLKSLGLDYYLNNEQSLSTDTRLHLLTPAAISFYDFFYCHKLIEWIV